MPDAVDRSLKSYLRRMGRLELVKLGGKEGEARAPIVLDAAGEELYFHFQRQVRVHNALLGGAAAAPMLFVLLGTALLLWSVNTERLALTVLGVALVLMLLGGLSLQRIWREKVVMDLVLYVLRTYPSAEAARLIEVLYWGRRYEHQGRRLPPPPNVRTVEYDDFVVRFRPDRGEPSREHPAWLDVSSPAGEAVELFKPDLDILNRASRLVGRRGRCRVLGALDRFRHLMPLSSGGDDARALGEDLFRALFTGSIRDRYHASRGQLLHQPGRGLRIRLSLNPKLSQLAWIDRLPWEGLYCPNTSCFLGQQRDTAIVHSLDVGLPADPPVPAPPLRILVISSLPSGLLPLDLHREKRRLEALRRLADVEVVSAGRADLATLRECLCGSHFHVLHYMGHGDLDPASGEGMLYLENQNGDPLLVSGQELADEIVAFRSSLRLVVINACHGARSSRLQPFSGIAIRLVEGGLMGVVAMQMAISDDGAIAFSEAFYRRLIAGDPLDAAVTEGRRALARRDPRSLEWVAPVLYLRSTSGRVFEPRPSVGSPRAGGRLP